MAAATKKAAAKQVVEKAPEEQVVLGVVPRGQLLEIPLGLIRDPDGPSDRIDRPGDEERTAEVARSLREVGQLQPIMVEERQEPKHVSYTRVFGRRRLAAARYNLEHHKGKDTILAIVVPPLEPDVRRTIVAVENVQRQDLTPAEEHLAVFELLELQAITAAKQLRVPLIAGGGGMHGKVIDDDFAAAIQKKDAKDQRVLRHDILLDHRVRARACELVAAMLAKPPAWVRDRMYIGRLGEKSRRLVLEGKLPLTHASEIAKVADPEIREDLAKSFAAGGDDSISDTEAGSIDDLKGEVSERVFNLKVVPWRLDAPIGNLPACNGCPHNSANNPGLFEHGGDVSDTMVGGVGRRDWRDRSPKDLGAVCTQHTCYGQKLRTTKGAMSAAAKRIVDGEKKVSEAKVPAFIDEKALEKKVRDRRALKKARPSQPRSSGSSRSQDSSVPYDQRPGYKANKKYETALDTWAKPARRSLEAALKKDPLLGLALSMLFAQKDIDDLKDSVNYEGVYKRAKKTLPPQALRDLVAKVIPLKHLAQLQELATTTQHCELYLDGPGYGCEEYIGLFEATCEALGIKIQGPRPRFPDFLAAEKKDTKATTPAAKKPAKSAKAAAGGKAVRP